MSRKLIIRGQAKLDIAEAAVWYNQQKQGLGEDFLAEARLAVQAAVENPNRFPVNHAIEISDGF